MFRSRKFDHTDINTLKLLAEKGKAILSKHKWLPFLPIVVFFVAMCFELSERAPFIDEFFLMRISYIQFVFKDIRPQIVSPYTYIVGILLLLTKSYKLVLIGMRIFNLLILLFGVGYVSSVTRMRWAPLGFCVLLLLNPYCLYLITQARYDSIIYLAAFFFLGLLYQGKELGWWSILLSAILLTSPPKGFYYFSAIFLVFLVRYFCSEAIEREKIIKYFLKVLAVSLFILCVFTISGVIDPFFLTIQHHFKMASHMEPNTSVSNYISKEIFVSGVAFYVIFLISIFLFFQKRLYLCFRKDVLIYMFSVIFLGWFYFFRHQRAYFAMTMAADLVLSFFILFTVLKTWPIWKNSAIIKSLLVLALSFQLLVNPAFGFKAKLKSGPESLQEILDTVELSHSYLEKNHKLFDPSGLIYFATPCTNEWFTDAPYADLSSKGDWMQGLDLSQCSHIIFNRQLINLDFNQKATAAKLFEADRPPFFKRRSE